MPCLEGIGFQTGIDYFMMFSTETKDLGIFDLMKYAHS